MFKPEKSVLLVIDVQGKLARLMHDQEKLFRHLKGLIHTAQVLDIPILVTEQVPHKIGATDPEIASLIKGFSPIIKSTFSCCAEKTFMQALTALKRKEVIVIGIETHVCVYQTVADLVRLKYQVQVVSDAVSSRQEEHKNRGLDRIRQIGGGITVSEMIICELLHTAKHPKFRQILQLIK